MEFSKEQYKAILPAERRRLAWFNLVSILRTPLQNTEYTHYLKWKDIMKYFFFIFRHVLNSRVFTFIIIRTKLSSD